MFKSTHIIEGIYFYHPSLSSNPFSWYKCDLFLIQQPLWGSGWNRGWNECLAVADPLCQPLCAKANHHFQDYYGFVTAATASRSACGWWSVGVTRNCVRRTGKELSVFLWFRFSAIPLSYIYIYNFTCRQLQMAAKGNLAMFGLMLMIVWLWLVCMLKISLRNFAIKNMQDAE